jgi:uncharacterized protein with FMN-binding domain
MRKTLVAVVIMGVFIAYCFLHNSAAAVGLTPPSTTNPDGGSGTSGTSGGSGTPGTSSTSGGTFKDGAYTGSVADAQWGYVQVRAVIKSGKITDVQFVQYPSDRARSVEINQYADPQLTSEAIQAQSAQVDIITGATDSSVAFMQSLSDALSQAQG